MPDHRPINPTRRGLSLLEMVASLAAMSVLLVAMGSAVVVSSRGVDAGASPPSRTAAGADAAARLTAELQLAVSVTQRDATGITFTVPDRDGDTLPETIDWFWSGGPAFQLLRSVNGDSPRIVARDVQSFALSYETRFVAGEAPPPSEDLPPRVVVVVEDPDNLEPSEVLLREWIFDWGYLPVTIASWATAADLTAALDDATAVYITSNVVNTTFLPLVRDAPIGVVAAHATSVTTLGLADAYTQLDKLKIIEVLEPDHYITSGMGLTSQIFTDDRKATSLRDSDGPAAGLLTLATKDGDANNRILSCLDAGALLAGGGSAAGRRVALPWGVEPLDFDKLTDAGRLLIQRAIVWAAGDEPSEGGGGGELRFGFDDIFPNTTINVESMQIATRATLAEPGTLTALLVHTNDAHDVRLAVYDDAGGEPGVLIVQSAVGRPSGTGWFEIAVPPTALAAGDYWLALSFKSKSQTYFWASGGPTRSRWHDAVGDGFLTNWGTSGSAPDQTISIHGVYTPDGGP